MPVNSSDAYDPSRSMTLDPAERPRKIALRYFLHIPPNHDKEGGVNVQDPNASSEPSSEPLRFRSKDGIVLFPPKSTQAQDDFIAIQKWEGYVSHLGEDTFEATLVCLKGEGPDQYAEIFFEDVSDDDRALISIGAVFYWTIGYLEKPSGQRLRASLIRFRRLPVWTRRELANAEIRAKELESLFDAE